ncbi:hypothetical protein, partial [Pseudomonas aeruginosa]|uniref:hypothetical protein n=2 Tax=Pseudomonas aeruginosa TaxID=287 RepID=UPI001C130DA6
MLKDVKLPGLRKLSSLVTATAIVAAIDGTNEKSAQCWALSGSMMTGKNPMFLAPGLDLRPTEPEGYAGADNHQAGHEDHAELG